MMRVPVLLLASALAVAASPVIDDRGLRSKFQEELAKVAEREDHVSGKDLAAQLEKARKRKTVQLPTRPASDGMMRYDDEVKGVVMVSSAYKCDRCDEWHVSGVASGWVLSADGLMVTNYHVLADTDKEVYGVMTLDGKFAEVTELLLADPAADLAVFRVAGEGFTPLPLAKEAGVGEAVHVISHPDGRYFTYTAGRVSRFYKRTGKSRRPSTWMAITADYARGSSGGPVFNDRGEVVGMVSSTSSLYYRGEETEKEKQKGPLQMVIKNCVSLPELRRALVEEGKTAKIGE